MSLAIAGLMGLVLGQLTLDLDGLSLMGVTAGASLLLAAILLPWALLGRTRELDPLHWSAETWDFIVAVSAGAKPIGDAVPGLTRASDGTLKLRLADAQALRELEHPRT